MKKIFLNANWKKLFVISSLVIYFYIFMEWVFFVTKPSFMDQMSIFSKFSTLFTTGGAIVLFYFVLLTIFMIFDLLYVRLITKNGSPFFHLGIFGVSVLLSTCLLILVDNFTYTVFKFGIVSLSGVWRGVYALGYILLTLYCVRWIYKNVSVALKQKREVNNAIVNFLLVLSIFFILLQSSLHPMPKIQVDTDAKNFPNILLIGSDGVNAENMSVYGYQRETTPFIDKKVAEFLIAQNAFSNSDNTTMSTTSMLTGKLPGQINLAKNTDILLGAASYQHLPGILRNLGYYNVQIGVPQYVDAYKLNFLDGFDLVNQRSYSQSRVFEFMRSIGLSDAAYFMSIVFERASSRLFHVFYIQKMENPVEVVSNYEQAGALSDQGKMEQIIALVENNERPVFIHAHLMGTHGPHFYPTQILFSKGGGQDKDWMVDYYDDAIKSFDFYLEELYGALAESGELENTIIIIYTDHNMGYHTNQRIPLLIRFPKEQFAGSVKNNVQNIDIAPTVLDYLKIKTPDWMAGLSFLRDEPPQSRLIFSGNTAGRVKVVQCDKWYVFNETDGTWLTGHVAEHTDPCGPSLSREKGNLPKEILEFLAEQKIILRDHADLGDVPFYYTKGQITSVLLRKKYGPDYVPPAAAGIFVDVQVSNENSAWIEQAYRDHIVEACSLSPLSYCPDNLVTREEAAMYVLKTLYGDTFVPRDVTGIFADVDKSSPFTPWIEELYRRHITNGCSSSPLNFCPLEPILGEHFMIFLSRAYSTQ